MWCVWLCVMYVPLCPSVVVVAGVDVFMLLFVYGYCCLLVFDIVVAFACCC